MLLDRAPDLVEKLCRADLGHAFRYGAKPQFFRHNTSFARCTLAHKSPKANSQDQLDIPELVPRIDRRLADVWEDLRHFCHQSNIASYTGQRFTRRTYDDIMISVQYRLHYMPLPPSTDVVSRALQAGMLTLAASLYFGWQHQHRPQGDDQDRLAQPLSDALSNLKLENDEECPDLVAFWLVMLWKSLVSTELSSQRHNALLEDTATRLHLRLWKQAETVLKSLGWISAVHGPRGSLVFRHLVPCAEQK